MKKIFTLLCLTAALLVGGVQKAEADVTIKVKAATAPRIHAWQTDGDGNYTEWPGDEMTKSGEYYSYTISCNENVSFLFYNNGNQTSNIENLNNGSTAYFTYDGTTGYTQLPYVSGTENLCGVNWGVSDDNVMTLQDDGTFVLTKNVTLANDEDVECKAVQFGHWYGTSGEGSSNAYIHGAGGKAGNYTINVYFNPNPGEYKTSFTLTPEFNGYYLIGGSNTWSLGDKLTEDNGVYSIAVPNNIGAFAITPNTNLDGYGTVKNWGELLRPSANVTIDFTTISTQTATTEDHSQNWKIGTNNDATIMFAYNKSANTWTITQSQAVNVSEGWASYSNSNIYQSDKDAYVISKITENTATLTKITAGTAFAAGTGVLFNESATITPATESDYEGDNKLVGSGNVEVDVTTEDYVLAKVNGTVGFYKVKTNDKLAAHKAYLPSSAVNSANFIGMVFGDESTGISAVKGESEGMEIYNLAGQRQQSLKKGLNIVNGKKVLVK